MKAAPHVRLAGQITGCEGYVESAAVGLMAGRFAAAEALGQAPAPPPPETAHGALLAHITGGADADTFQPMNVNFGLFPPPPDGTPKSDRKAAHGTPGAGGAGRLAGMNCFRRTMAACVPRENC